MQELGLLRDVSRNHFCSRASVVGGVGDAVSGLLQVVALRIRGSSGGIDVL